MNRRNRTRLLCAGLVVLLLIGMGAAFYLNQESGKEPFILPTPQVYPQVSDLAPETEIDPNHSFASLSYGIHAFLWWNGDYRSWDLENVRLLNFAYVKQSFSWRDIQPQRGSWHWENADEVVAEILYRGRRIVARIDAPPDWALRESRDIDDPPYDLNALKAYCGELATRYKGKIEAYQIWNEPNLAREWGNQIPSAKGYTKLLAACSEAIRKADPDAIIISAGLAPTGTRDESALPDEEYLWELYKAGFSQYFDVLGLHAPGYAFPPDATEEEVAAAGHARWARFRHVEDMRAIMVENGDADKQIAIMEMGWTLDTRPDSIYAWFAVTQEQQAEYLVAAYAYAAEHWRPWVGLMVTIYMADYAWTPENEEWWWALNEPRFEPHMLTYLRPSYYALANMEKISDNPQFSEPARGADWVNDIVPLPPRN